MSLRVTITDEQTGEVEECQVADGDYTLVLADPAHLHHVQITGKPYGACHILTIRGRIPREQSSLDALARNVHDR